MKRSSRMRNGTSRIAKIGSRGVTVVTPREHPANPFSEDPEASNGRPPRERHGQAPAQEKVGVAYRQPQGPRRERWACDSFAFVERRSPAPLAVSWLETRVGPAMLSGHIGRHSSDALQEVDPGKDTR